MFVCRIFFPVTLCLFCAVFSFAQKVNSDSVYKLPEVKVEESRLENFSAGLSSIKIESSKIKNSRLLNLSEIISENSPVFMKTYGQGSLATVSIRGTGAAHAGLFWNGININTPNLGLSDFALLPAALLGDVEIQQGSSAALYGSGVIGGAVHLISKPVFIKASDISVSMLGGSFGLLDGSLLALFSNEQWYVRGAAFYRSCENNFPYINTAKFNKPEEKLVSADYYGYGATAEAHRYFRKNYIVSFHAWHSYMHRNLPPAMTGADNGEQQSDSSFRFLAEAKKIFPKSSLKARVAWLNEHQRYENKTIALINKPNTQGIVSEAEFAGELFAKIKMNAGINYTFYAANIQEYLKQRTRNQGAVFLSLLRNFDKLKWKTVLNLRQELTEGYRVPFTPSLGAEGNLWKIVSARANVSRSFRVPTLNDIFWQPGGNPDLKPESGWNAETGLFLSQSDSAKVFTPSASVSVFSSWIDNWIVWQPTTFSYWQPLNLQKVWARGLEASSELKFRKNKTESRIQIFYSYTLSTIEETSALLQASLGKQLIYVPQHNLNGILAFRWKNISLTYMQIFTGKRYTTSDNNSSLPSFTIGNTVLNYDLRLNKITVSAGVRVNNIWNTNYQAIAYRPMPGRNFSFSIIIHYSQPNQQTNN